MDHPHAVQMNALKVVGTTSMKYQSFMLKMNDETFLL